MDATTIEAPDHLANDRKILDEKNKVRTPRRRGADPYDTLLWRLQPRLEGRLSGGYLLGVTGCDSRAGVTTVATNLAIRAADNQVRPTLLIDANTSAPKLASTFRLRKAYGLAEILAGECSIEEATHGTSIEGMETMPLGSAGLIDRIGVDHRLVEGLLDNLREAYELVVFDLPIVPRLRHALLIARRLDGVVMAVKNEASPAGRVEEAANSLREDNVELVGSVLTRQRQYTPRWLRRWI